LSDLTGLFGLVHPVLINISLVVLDELQKTESSSGPFVEPNQPCIKPEMETYVKGEKHFNLPRKKPNVLPPKE